MPFLQNHWRKVQKPSSPRFFAEDGIKRCHHHPPPENSHPIAIWKEGAPSGMWLSSADTFPPQQGKETSKKTLEFQTSGYNPPKGGLLFRF